MFGLFKKKELPPFNELSNSPLKDKFFIRTSRWDWLNESMIHVFDNNAPRMITMDPWPQLIFLAAKGESTVHEFVYEMASQYGRKPVPEELDLNILELINDLVDDQLIALMDSKKELPYYLDQPIADQDQEKANQLMLWDGFIKE